MFSSSVRGVFFRARAVSLALALLCAAVSGCGYQVGSIKIGENKKIAILPFANKTSEPNLETKVTNAVIYKMQVDGSYKVVATPEEADYVLVGELISYSRDAIAFDRSDVTREYRGMLTARLLFKDAKTDKVLWVAKRVEGEIIFPTGSDQAENERNQLPKLAEDLAKYVVETVVNGGW